MKPLLFFLFHSVTFVFGQEHYSFQDSLLLFGHHQEFIQQLKSRPATADAHYKLGVVYFDQANYYNALTELQQAIHLDNKLLYQLKLIEVYQKLKRYEEAEKHLVSLQNKFPRIEVFSYKTAKLFMAQKKWSKASEVLNKLIKKDSLNIDFQYDLGTVFMGEKNYSKAINQFLTAYALDSTHFNCLYRLAASFQKLNQKDSTYLFIQKGLKLRPHHKNLNRIYINQLRRDHHINKALSILKEQDSLFPWEHFNKKLLGILYYNLNALKEADLFFEQALKINIEDYKSNTYRGHIALKQKRFQGAFFQFFAALSKATIVLDEENFGIAMTQIGLGNFKAAQTYLEAAYKQNKNNAAALFELAKIVDHNHKDDKKAYFFFKEYIKRFPNHNQEQLDYAFQRIKQIKEAYFMQGEILD